MRSDGITSSQIQILQELAVEGHRISDGWVWSPGGVRVRRVQGRTRLALEGRRLVARVRLDGVPGLYLTERGRKIVAGLP